MSRGTILLVEDSLHTRNIIKYLLEINKFAVREFENGKTAWEYLQKEAVHDLKAVITDIMMPELDGLSLVALMRGDARYAEVPVILTTALSDKDYILKAKDLKATSYILKPLDGKKILESLKKIFPNEKFMEARK